ncbi:hypothetical protein ACWZHB_19500 [Nocardia sp. FBN12]|uniref:hypothetical protein n=1 Tax=Nocardia sp. FBN12 TaxID=3419766 RepID=UPI003D03A9FB
MFVLLATHVGSGMSTDPDAAQNAYWFGRGRRRCADTEKRPFAEVAAGLLPVSTEVFSGDDWRRGRVLFVVRLSSSLTPFGPSLVSREYRTASTATRSLHSEVRI